MVKNDESSPLHPRHASGVLRQFLANMPAMGRVLLSESAGEISAEMLTGVGGEQ